uniref:ANK_REP_REGION domain-containing protein n=1 Tax=Macrostomum lignano TaxID=282301 RepID=A0A1I8FPW0_9PLAT
MLPKQRLEWLRQRGPGSHCSSPATRSHYEMASQLLSSGANVNATTAFGRSPLHVAAAKNNGDIINPAAGERRLFMFRWQQRATSAEAAVSLIDVKEFQRSDFGLIRSWRDRRVAAGLPARRCRPPRSSGTAPATRRDGIGTGESSRPTPEELLTQRTSVWQGRFLRAVAARKEAQLERRKVIEGRAAGAREQERGQAEEELDQQLAQLTLRRPMLSHDGSAGGPGGHALPPIAGHDGQQADRKHPGQQAASVGRRSDSAILDPRLNALRASG